MLSGSTKSGTPLTVAELQQEPRIHSCLFLFVSLFCIVLRLGPLVLGNSHIDFREVVLGLVLEPSGFHICLGSR